MGKSMHAKDTDRDDFLASDLISGGRQIAAFWGMTERKCRHLLLTHQLPGAFQIGGLWYQSKSKGRKAVEVLASAGMPEEGSEPVRTTPLNPTEIERCTLSPKAPPSRAKRTTAYDRAYAQGWYAGHVDTLREHQED
jgi:hypothetical protein